MIDGFETRISYINSTKLPLQFILEPWAEEFELLAGSTLDLIVTSKNSTETSVFEQTDSELIFYAGSESLVRVFIDGEDVSVGSAEIMTPSGPKPITLVKALFRPK